MPTTRTPQERARAAADSLAARGEAVTARAVRAEAAVRMDVAAAAAAEWQAAAASKAEAAPEMPDSVQTRIAGIWQVAYTTAAAAFADQRAGLEQRAKQAEDERDALIADVAALETTAAALTTERDAAQGKVEALVERAAKAEAEATLLGRQLVGERERHDAALAAERDANAALRAEIATLKADAEAAGKA